MAIGRELALGTLKAITGIMFRVDAEQMEQVPMRGPLILVVNHVNIPEGPTIFTRLRPRPVTGLVLASRWDNPLLRWLLELTGAIPLRRGEADVTAMRRAMELLEAGHIVIIAPEGTRSGNGCLQPAHPGAVLLALRSGASLLPLVHYGSERYQQNLRRLRRTDFHIVVGKSFRLDPGDAKVNRDVRRQMIDEVMYRLATLLPAGYRGVYADLNKATDSYLVFD